MAPKGVDTLRELSAKYWAPAISLLAFLPSLIEFLSKLSKGQNYLEPRLWWLFVGGLLISLVVRFPRLAIFVTRLLLPRIEPELPKTLIFRGPIAYSETDAQEFFGRGTESSKCWLDLKDSGFFVIDGVSGAGKSSFLNAELLPKARQSFTAVVCRVPNDPFSAVAAALREASEPEQSPADSLTIKLGDLDVLVRTAKGKPLLIFLDQFDEFFLTVDHATRSRFFHAIREVIASKKARVAVCIRSDFLDLLLAECRSIDPKQEILSLNRYYTLDPFTPEQALGIMKLMLQPFHGQDPVRRQQLEDFASELITQLQRPTSDKRKPRDPTEVVLPVELQIVGFMAESSDGSNGLSRDTLIRLGGRLGLYRAYLETAKDYVWRTTGISGDDALLILRQLISSASTKHSQSVQEISSRLNKSTSDVSKSLKCFSDKYLVRRVPGGDSDPSAERYELMHEHLTEVLREAPEPYLQKLRDAEERLAFWSGRAMQASAISKPEGPYSWVKKQFSQPVPILEALSLRRFSRNQSDRHLLRASVRVFLVKSGCCGLLLFLPILGAYKWRQRDESQMDLLIADAPYKQNLHSPQLGDWSTALALLRKIEPIERIASDIPRDADKARLLISASEVLSRSGDPEDGVKLLSHALRLPVTQWSSELRSALDACLATAPPERFKALLENTRQMPPGKTKALTLSAVAYLLSKSGDQNSSTSVFGETGSIVTELKTASEKAEAEILIAEDEWQANYASGAKNSSDEALVFARQAETANEHYPISLGELLARWAAQRIRICCLTDAPQVLRESEGHFHPGSDLIFDNYFAPVAVAFARAKQDDALILLTKSFSGENADEIRASFAGGLTAAGFTEKALTLVNVFSGRSAADQATAKKIVKAVRLQLLRGAVDQKNVQEARAALAAVQQIFAQERTGEISPWDRTGYYDFRRYSLDKLTKELVDLGLVDEAVQLADSFGLRSDEFDGPVDLYSSVALELAQKGVFERAMAVARKVVPPKPSESKSRSARALVTFADLSLGAPSLRCDLFARIAMSSIRAGRILYLDDVAQCSAGIHGERYFLSRLRFQSQSNQILGDPWAQVLGVLAEVDPEAAEKYLSKLSDEGRVEETRRAIVLSEAKSGKVELAYKLAETLPDSSRVSSLLADVVVAAAESGHADQLDMAKHRIAYPEDESKAFGAIARWQARQHHFRQAFTTASACSLPADKLAAYTAIIEEFARSRGHVVPSANRVAANQEF